MPKRVTILNGPNLNTLGTREPSIYGKTTLAAIEASCRELADAIGVALAFQQTNHEGALVEQVQAARKEADALVINPAACTFHSVALVDALAMFEKPVIELHISNIHARDEAHRHSMVSPAAKAVICGLGAYGYPVALMCAARLLNALPNDFPAPLRLGPR
jgi:3-dehydroquinate dehydratase-2